MSARQPTPPRGFPTQAYPQPRPRTVPGVAPPAPMPGYPPRAPTNLVGSPYSARTITQVTPAVSPVISVRYPDVGGTLTSPRGDYVITSVIGSGEFGAVYECVGPFDQIYALKMIRPANRAFVHVQTEWAREVSRLQSLRHPNVVYIYDAFVQDYLFYLALERCDYPLTEMLGSATGETSTLSEALIIELARQILAAVQFLHDNDVVHDDLHAGNVLVTHTDRPVVKISDFGISHELRGASSVRPSVVHHSVIAPEILASGYTSKQSDLYQIGLLLYWMITGHPILDPSAPNDDLMRQVADGEPRRRAEAIGTPLGALVAKMLRRREQFRYTSAREVWADLRELPAWRNRQLFLTK